MQRAVNLLQQQLGEAALAKDAAVTRKEADAAHELQAVKHTAVRRVKDLLARIESLTAGAERQSASQCGDITLLQAKLARVEGELAQSAVCCEELGTQLHSCRADHSAAAAALAARVSALQHEGDNLKAAAVDAVELQQQADAVRAACLTSCRVCHTSKRSRLDL